MSLNGLDEPPVIEAYQAALAEAGGWFLLKYVTRDAVDPLGRGSGGVVDVRNAIAQYEEKSALYGFVQYRRRKVLLKYVPEGTSRLLLARVTVHFQSVLDKFSPHDTVFSLTAPTDLTETALSAACLLHTASGSLTSSSSSLRRRRLREITEDAEDGGDEKDAAPPDRDGGIEGQPKQRKSDLSQQVDPDAPQDLPSPRKETSAPAIPQLKEPPPAETSHDNRKLANDEFLPPTPHDASDVASLTVVPERNFLDELSRPSYERRQSSQSTRPAAWELDRTGQYNPYKPKVKLGPRPSLDYSRRPKTSGSQYRQSEPRPVASLPSSVRVSGRKLASSRPKSPKSPASAVSEPAFSTPKGKPEDLPPLPSPPPNVHIPALYSPPSIKVAAPRPVSIAPRSPGITPEKQRLMKAVELRKQQMAQMAQAGDQKADKPKEVPQAPAHLDDKAAGEATEALDTLPEMSKSESLTDIVHVNLSRDQVSDHGRPITSPVSLPETSEGPSTQGSSFTEESEMQTNDVDDTPTQEAVQGKLDAATIRSDLKPTLEPEVSEVSDVHEGGAMDALGTAHTHSNNEGQSPVEDKSPVRNSEETSTSTLTIPRAVPASRTTSTPKTPVSEVDLPVRPTEKETLATAASEIACSIENGVTPGFETRDEHDSLIDTRPSTANTNDQINREKKNKRRAMVEPIKVLSSAENSEDDLPSDDEFMEELKSARVEEAKPVSVARSPITPVFGNGKGNGEVRPTEMVRSNRAVSVPSELSSQHRNASPSGSKASTNRSFSAALPAWPPTAESTPALVVKKTNVSSGISKRIKALEMFTSRDTSQSPPSSQGSATTSSSHFASFRKLKHFTHNAPNVTTQTSPPVRLPDPSPTPEPQPQSLPSIQRHTSASKSHTPKRRDSVSVTARIVRNPSGSTLEEPANPSEPGPLNLQRSPLIVEHDKKEPVPRPSMEAESRMSPKLERRRPSFSSVRSRRNSSSAHLPHSESRGSRLTLTGRTMHSEGNLPRAMSNFSDNSSIEGEKKESRKSRLMKRMSSITSNSRRSLINAISPTTVKEEAPAPLVEQTESPIAETPPQVVEIGDVNVQFPDTLLWKRRFMRIDDQGYLILTPPNMDTNARNISKKYHLSEFRKPCIPDLERQELPNSILLDFADGTTLQCACESRYTQQQVLQALVDAHRAYHQLYSP